MLRIKKYPKRSPNFLLYGTVGGVSVFESTGTPDRGLAEQYRVRRERQIYEEAALGKVQPATFADAVAVYVNKGKPKRFLTVLLDHFKETPLADIGQVEIDAAARALYPTAKASTLNRQLFGPMVAIMRSAVRAKLPGAYVPIWERRDEDKPQINPADDAHLDALMPHLDEGLMRLIWLMSFTGLRTGEALRVNQDGIRDGYAVVGKTKNGDPRMVPLPEGWEYPSGGWGTQCRARLDAQLQDGARLDLAGRRERRQIIVGLGGVPGGHRQRSSVVSIAIAEIDMSGGYVDGAYRTRAICRRRCSPAPWRG